MSKNNKKHDYKSALKYLFHFIKPHKKWYISASVVSLLLVGTGILYTKNTEILIDSSIAGDGTKIIQSLILFLLIIAINIILNYISKIYVSKLAAHASKDLKRHISKLVLYAKYGSIKKLKSGDILSTINTDTEVVCNFIASDLVGLFAQFSLAIGAMGYIIYINPLLALVTFAFTPVGMFFTLSLNKKMNILHPINADYKGIALSVVEQALMQIPVIKSFMM